MARKPNFARLAEVLTFDPISGHFSWRVALARSCPAGSRAGCITNDRYVCITVDGAKFLAHRLAWRFTFDAWPSKFIDHIDGNRGNNRPSNLRNTSKQINAQNRKVAHRGSASGVLGVRRSLNRWTARINITGKDIHLGSFDTPELAHAAYVLAKRLHHEGCTI